MSRKRRKFPKNFHGMTSRQIAYQHFLDSQQWKSLARCAKARAGMKCQNCGSQDRLEAHHTFYPDDWTQTQLDHLQVLCRSCHRAKHPEKAHRKRRKKDVDEPKSFKDLSGKALRTAQKQRRARLKQLGGIGPTHYNPVAKTRWVTPRQTTENRLIYSIRDQQFYMVKTAAGAEIPRHVHESSPGMVNRPGNRASGQEQPATQ